MGGGLSKHEDEVTEARDKPKQPPASVSTDAAPAPEKEQAPAGGGGCPMKRSDGSYSYNIGAAFFGQKKHPHGPNGSVPLETKKAGEENTPVQNTQQSGEGGGCPVKHSTPVNQEDGGGGGCPVKHHQPQYNVYSQPIDPKNQMPNLNQLPSPGQKEALPTERVQSTIPKGGGDDDETTTTTWTYPSPQMFYNALARKGKLGSTQESDIPSVVALHNNMNEKTWTKILEWEAVLYPSSPNPMLLKFMGRPSDLSPKARFKHWVLGHPLPFDRHDWTIVREDGSTSRYVIDYYHDDTRASVDENSGFPAMHDFEATQSLLVDVRPALDGPSDLVGRVVNMPYARRFAKSTPFTPMPLMPTADMKKQVGESIQVWDDIQKAAKQKQAKTTEEQEEQLPPEISKKEAVALAQSFASVLKDCQEAQKKVGMCETEEECAKASMDLTMCMAKIVCPLQHEALTTSLNANDENEEEYHAHIEAALENVSVCVAGANERAAMAKLAHPEAFEGAGK